jgi:hypothetical protein
MGELVLIFTIVACTLLIIVYLGGARVLFGIVDGGIVILGVIWFLFGTDDSVRDQPVEAELKLKNKG